MTDSLLVIDAADTLLVKHGIDDVYRHHMDTDLTTNEIYKERKALTETTTFPQSTSYEFYYEFNKLLFSILGNDFNDSVFSNLYQDIKSINWTPFSNAEETFINNFPKRIGVASNWGNGLRDILSNTYDAYFDPIIISSEVGHDKPNPQFFDCVLEGIYENTTVTYVGDSLRLDIEPLLSTNINCILLDRFDFYNKVDCPKIKSLTELNT